MTSTLGECEWAFTNVLCARTLEPVNTQDIYSHTCGRLKTALSESCNSNSESMLYLGMSNRCTFMNHNAVVLLEVWNELRGFKCYQNTQEDESGIGRRTAVTRSLKDSHPLLNCCSSETRIVRRVNGGKQRDIDCKSTTGKPFGFLYRAAKSFGIWLSQRCKDALNRV